MSKSTNPLNALLRHHVTGAIERGEAEAIVESTSEGHKRMNTNRQTFIQLYVANLRAIYGANEPWLAKLAANAPDLPHTIEELAARITEGLITGKANKDSDAIKRTCRQAGIKHTYTAIRAYLVPADPVA